MPQVEPYAAQSRIRSSVHHLADNQSVRIGAAGGVHAVNDFPIISRYVTNEPVFDAVESEPGNRIIALRLTISPARTFDPFRRRRTSRWGSSW